MTATREYIKNILKNKLPALDVSDGSPLSELFVNPVSAVMDPVLIQLKYLLDNLGLKDPELINPTELDAIAGNFLVYRRQAIPASGYIEMFFDTAQGMLVPQGTTFTSNDNRQYVTTSDFVVAESTMQANLWKFPLFSTGLIPVISLVDSLGTPLAPGSIVSTDFAPVPVQVTNPVSFSAGVVVETNTEFATRLIDSVMNKSLASEQSYINLISENFPSVKETMVIGTDDERMIRDLRYSGMDSLESYYLVDYRGKISVSDFYVSASGGYYIKTSGLFDSVPNFDEYPYPQSKAFWTLFYDDPASSGIVPDLPMPDEYAIQYTTSQYANLYYLKDSYKTTLHTAILLQDPFVGGALDARWVTGDVHIAANKMKNSFEILPTDNGVRLGYTPTQDTLAALSVPISKGFLGVIKDTILLALRTEVGLASLIDASKFQPYDPIMPIR
jgi:hypothetical protein